MSNFSVNYIPTTDEVYGLQNFGVLTVFNYTGTTGGTGLTGPVGPVGSVGPQGGTGPAGISSISGSAGDILYSNGSGIGVTGGLLWNEGTQALNVNSITSNTYGYSGSLHLYPYLAPTTLNISSNIAVTGNTGTTIYNFTTTSPNYANTWGMECSYSLVGNNTATGSTGIAGAYIIATTGSNSYTFGSSLIAIIPVSSNTYILNAIDQTGFGGVIGPNTSLNLKLYFVSNFDSSITVYHPSITTILTTLNYRWFPTS